MARTKPPKQSFASDSRTTGQNGAVFLSSFHATLPLFASAVLSLDAWHVKIADYTTSALRNEYALDKGLVCQCLAWGTASTSSVRKSKKKRRVDDASATAAHQEGLLAAGTNHGAIYLYNPSEDVAIATLQGGHNAGVSAMAWSDSAIWSAGPDGKVVEWDSQSHTMLRSITVDSSHALSAISVSATNLLAASYTIHHFTLPAAEAKLTYTTHTSPVHTLLYGPKQQHFVSAATDDRYMNVFALDQSSQLKALVAGADVKKAALAEGTLCAVTVDGTVEVFADVFTTSSTTQNKRRKSQVSAPSSIIRVVRPDSVPVLVADISMRPDNRLVLSWTEGARTVFETINLLREDGTPLESTEIVRARLPALGAPSATNGSQSKPVSLSEGNATVLAGHDLRDLDMTDGLEREDDDDKNSSDEERNEEEEDDDAATEEPTLAERLHVMDMSTQGGNPATTNPSTKPSSSSLQAAGKTVLNMPAASSLTTIMTQALKSNDTALLESCLHHSDSKVILKTIRRLDATLAATLLEQLASRMARRPGRATDLGVWVRWTLVVHGGYLASLPHLVKTCSVLHTVLAGRRAALPRLLALSGRISMVTAQDESRRHDSAQISRRSDSTKSTQRPGRGAHDTEDPSDVEYREGESDDDADEEEIAIDGSTATGVLDTSDEEEDEGDDDDDDDDEAGEFSQDSDDGNEYAELDAQMEMMQDVTGEGEEEGDEEVEGASDDEAT